LEYTGGKFIHCANILDDNKKITINIKQHIYYYINFQPYNNHK